MNKKSSTERTVTWQKRFSIARDNQSRMFKRFSQWYELFYATVTTSNIAPWRSKVFIPIMTGKVWNMVAKFVNLKPGFEVNLRNPEVEDSSELKDKADKMQLKLEYDYENPHLDEPIRDKLLAPLVDAIVCGTGIAKVPWKVKNKKRFERVIGEDGTVDLTKQKMYEKRYGCNDLIPVNIFNVFVAPTATNLYSSPWVIIKEYKTLNELEACNTAEGAEVYKNLDQLNQARQTSDEFAQYKKSRNRLVNSDDKISADTTVDHIAVYECYEGDMIYTFASGGTKSGKEAWVELRAQKNYYWHGKYPLVRFQMKQRPYEFWGEGVFEVTERLQSAVNDIFNHYMDNYNLSVDGMLMIEENSNVNDYIVQPGGEITYSGTAPQQFKFPEPNPAQVQNVMQMLERAIEDVTISPYATGMPNSSTDKTKGTATGILRLQQAAGDLISFLKGNFQQSIHQVGEMWLSNNQQFMDQDITLETMVNNKAQPVTIKPVDLQGDMELRIDDASMEPTTKEERAQAKSAFFQQAMVVKQAADLQHQTMGTPPIAFNFSEVLSDLADGYGEKNVDKLLLDQNELAELQPPQQGPSPEEVAQMAQAQKQPEAKPQVNYKDAPPDVKAQMEMKEGYAPSALYPHAMEMTGATPPGVPEQNTMMPVPDQADYTQEVIQ